MKTEIIRVHTGHRLRNDITPQCEEFARAASGGGDGLLHVFVPHATAGVAVIELGARSDQDLLAVLADLLPADDRWKHAHGSRGHGRSHVLPAFVAPFTLLPVVSGRLRWEPGSRWQLLTLMLIIRTGRCACRWSGNASGCGGKIKP